MSNVYVPDAWVIVRISREDLVVDKVFAGWYGGFARGDSWKLNSGITKIEEREHSYDVHGESGSIYTIHKQSERMSGYMMGVFYGIEKLAKLEGKATIEVLAIKDILEKYK
jgi:hypothetical protein